MRLYPGTTVDSEFQLLRTGGYTGSLNDMQYAFLGGEGLTGGLPDRMAKFSGGTPGGGIALVGSSQGGFNAGGGSVTLPGGMLEDDLVVVAISAKSAIDSSLITTAGYTSRYDKAGGDPGAILSYKFMGAVPDTTVSIGSAGNTKGAVVQVFRGVDTTTPFDFATVEATGTSGSPDSPVSTTVTANALFLSIGFLNRDNVTSVTAPTGYTDLVFQNDPNAANFSSTVMLSSKTIVSAGSEDPDAYVTNGNDFWVSLSEALRPA